MRLPRCVPLIDKQEDFLLFRKKMTFYPQKDIAILENRSHNIFCIMKIQQEINEGEDGA